MARPPVRRRWHVGLFRRTPWLLDKLWDSPLDTSGDTFNIIRFSSDASSLFPAPQIADTQARAVAARYIEGLVSEGGTEMRDNVHYDVGFGPLGDALNALAVRSRVAEIFAFRREVLEQRFGGMAPVEA